MNLDTVEQEFDILVASFEKALKVLKGYSYQEKVQAVHDSKNLNPTIYFKGWVQVGTARTQVTMNSVHSLKTSGMPEGITPEQRKAIIALRQLKAKGLELPEFE